MIDLMTLKNTTSLQILCSFVGFRLSNHDTKVFIVWYKESQKHMKWQVPYSSFKKHTCSLLLMKTLCRYPSTILPTALSALKMNHPNKWVQDNNIHNFHHHLSFHNANDMSIYLHFLLHPSVVIVLVNSFRSRIHRKISIIAGNPSTALPITESHIPPFFPSS